MSAKATELPARPALRRGDVVIVREPGLPERLAVVGSVKPTHHGCWYVDVEFEDGMTWAVPETYVEA